METIDDIVVSPDVRSFIASIYSSKTIARARLHDERGGIPGVACDSMSFKEAGYEAG
jgi:hypothetical protein